MAERRGVNRLMMWWRRHRERTCRVCASYQSDIWELRQRGFAGTSTQVEYRRHRLQVHPGDAARAC